MGGGGGGVGLCGPNTTASFVCVCAVYSVKDQHNLPNCLPLLRKTCVRQVVLDKWFPLNSIIIRISNSNSISISIIISIIIISIIPLVQACTARGRCHTFHVSPLHHPFNLQCFQLFSVSCHCVNINFVSLR